VSPLNLALIAGGPLVVIGSVWLLAQYGDRLAERDAEQMREYGRRQVELAKLIKRQAQQRSVR
jgi:hypothetical protein